MILTRRHVLALGGACLGAANTAFAQDGESLLAPDAVKRFPFGLIGARPWANVTIGRTTLPFLIDSAAEAPAIDAAAAANLGLAKRGAGYPVRAYDLGGAVVRSQDFAEMPADFGGVFRGVAPTARHTAFSLDFEQRMASVHIEPPAVADYKVIRGQKARGNRLLSVTAELDGQKLLFLVQTGLEPAVYLYPHTVRAMDLWSREGVDTMVRFPGGKARARATWSESLVLGPLEFIQPVIHLADPQGRSPHGEAYAGAIGMETLRRLNPLLHHDRGELWVRPNQMVNDIFAYDRAGLDIDKVGPDYRVSMLAKDGPAERAGLKMGDKVTGWVGPDGVEGLLWAIQGKPETRVQVQVEGADGGKLLDLTLKERI